MASIEEFRSALEQLEDMIGSVIERWQIAVSIQDELNVTDDEFVRKWKAIVEEVDRLNAVRQLLMDTHAEFKEKMDRLDRSNL